MKLPTDLEILNSIYKEYYEAYSNFREGEENGRDSKAYMPIDIKLIASKLNVDGGIVFGRLYNHLNKLHSYANDDIQKSKVPLFALQVGRDVHCIHFPMMSSVLAGLQSEKSKFFTTTWISLLAIFVSLLALAVSILK
ncbi:hypothetical protein [Pseudomonas lactis]|uniref:hypothetical protein n=1 Tax=Pseudomonas lactis TaxID=1615674 RepID=UPI001472DC13|nr:hypothetical protein [Pseudomonas lactis]NNA52101.1 hypothetical protein [Pseudomonas lactis]